MDVKSLKTKSYTELREMTAIRREEIRRLRFKLSSNALANVRSLRVAKKDIARIMTAINHLQKHGQEKSGK